MKKQYLLGCVCAFSMLSIQPVYANSIPIANAGPDQTVFLTRSILINGSATDPDGDTIVGWKWAVDTAPAGSNPVISGEFSADINFIADVEGDYNLSLSAFDDIDWSLPDYVTVTYVLNQFPTAVGVATPTIGIAPLTVNFDATKSTDPESANLLYLWEFGDFTAPVLAPIVTHTYQDPGTYFAELAVEDDFGQRDYTTIQINVSAVPIPAALWLFGSGILGFIGIARRKKS
jgi:PKD repeat protein